MQRQLRTSHTVDVWIWRWSFNRISIKFHFVSFTWRDFQNWRLRPRSQTVGHQEEPARHELWQTESLHTSVLQERHHPKAGRVSQTGVPVRPPCIMQVRMDMCKTCWTYWVCSRSNVTVTALSGGLCVFSFSIVKTAYWTMHSCLSWRPSHFSALSTVCCVVPTVQRTLGARFSLHEPISPSNISILRSVVFIFIHIDEFDGKEITFAAPVQPYAKQQ